MLQETRRLLAVMSFAAALILVLGSGPGALAQDQPAVAPGAVTEDQVDAFVDAAVAVQEVEREYGGRLQEVETAEEAEQLQQQAQMEAIRAVEDSGLNIEEYFLVLEAANADPELHAMIVERLQDRLE